MYGCETLLCATDLKVWPSGFIHPMRKIIFGNNVPKKQTPWPLVRERTILTERPPLVDEIYYQLLLIEGVALLARQIPNGR
jgi:hypothetical protein